MLTSSSRRKLFAILVMMGKHEKIVSFIQEGICDRHLPLQRNPDNCEWGYFETLGVDQVFKVVKCFKDGSWRRYEIDLVDKYQWYFLSPVFQFNCPELIHYSLNKSIPLPFIADISDEGSPFIGGFSDVRRVKIHPAHHDLKVRCNAFTTTLMLTNIVVPRYLVCRKVSSIEG